MALATAICPEFKKGDSPLRRFPKFWSDQRGNTAVLFGLAALPLIALSGGAVDFSHRADTRTKLQNATDTAALAAARAVQASQAEGNKKWGKVKKEAEDIAAKIFAASVTSAPGEEPKIQVKKDSVIVSAKTDVPTSFLGVLGIKQLAAAANSEVGIPGLIEVEIALVLDYSKSMEANDKYIRMTAAAQKFIEKTAKDRGERTKIGIVPFSEYVYASVSGAHVRGTPPAQANSPVAACLMNRDYPYSATTDEPKKSVDASRWPAADPASAQCMSYPANSLGMHDLTSDFTTLTDALSKMRPVGWTNIALGAEMGWHMLTSEPPFSEATNDKDARKILILLTDGVQTIAAAGPSGEVSTLAADQTTAELCQNAKAAKVQVFTIAYDIADPRVRGLLAGCASDTASYHEPKEAGDISAVFQAIFDQIAQSVWLRR